MKKDLSSLTIETENETITISQKYPMDEEAIIAISVETVDILIEWLTQARDEILKTKDQG